MTDWSRVDRIAAEAKAERQAEQAAAEPKSLFETCVDILSDPRDAKLDALVSALEPAADAIRRSRAVKTLEAIAKQAASIAATATGAAEDTRLESRYPVSTCEARANRRALDAIREAADALAVAEQASIDTYNARLDSEAGS